jgi:DnaJ-class molecular chaperone
VHLTVTVPAKLNDEQAALLRTLADLRNEQSTQVGVGDAESSGLFSKLKGSFKSR